ncbi:hypothetical protein VCHA53O466_140046 [Vibrio chagasii]|nr:hypothetical protein VCHA53O466_140046 [Vibrio chagasii]
MIIRNFANTVEVSNIKQLTQELLNRIGDSVTLQFNKKLVFVDVATNADKTLSLTDSYTDVTIQINEVASEAFGN